MPRPREQFFCAVLILLAGACRGARAPESNFVYIGGDAKTPGTIAVAVNPVAKFDGWTKRAIYDLRRSEIAKHPELVDDRYAPSDEVFGQIADGRPWWGLEGIYFYGPGQKAIEGPSEESRFVSNPLLLLGIRESYAASGRFAEGGSDYYPVLKRLEWTPSKAAAKAVYAVAAHFAFADAHGDPPEISRLLEATTYNAKDLGFDSYALDESASSGVRMETAVPDARAIHQYIHCGSSCGYPGGCNNKSPLSHQNFFRVEKVPAVAVFKLWRQNPSSPAAPADMTFKIEMN